MYSYYKAHDYARMLGDGRRVRAYAAALERAVRPGSRVLDLGCGSGILSMLASRLGAAKVVAVEPNRVIELARSLARANGFADRIHFVQGLTSDLDFDERFDVIVSDLRGTTPLHGLHIPAIIDARTRLLAPGGMLIPRCDHLMVAGVKDPDLHREAVRPWQESFGFDLDLLVEALARTPAKKQLTAEQTVLEARCWGKVDYVQVRESDVRGTAEWEVRDVTRLYALVVWFDATLYEDIGYSNAPGGDPMIYGHLFLPLPAPLDLEPGDRLRVELGATLRRRLYRWAWRGLTSRRGGPFERAFEV